MANLINIDDNDSKNNLITKLQKAIQSANLNFLLGSGCSKPAINTLGSVEKDYQTLYDSGKVDEAERLLFVFLKPFLLLPAEWKTSVDVMETFENYKVFLEAVSRILAERKNSLLLKRATVFTTNYDLFMEGAFEESDAQIHLIDGFKRGPGVTNSFKFSSSEFFSTVYNDGNLYNYKVEIPSVNLIKLHGSLSWKINKDEIAFSVDHLGGLKAEHETLSKSGNATGISDFNKKFSIVLPRKEKFKETLLDKTYYDLLRVFANELDKENTLLITDGFSFTDGHIFDITTRALRNPTLMLAIFSYDKSASEDYSKLFSSFNNVDIIYSDSSQIPFSKFNSILGEVK